MLGLDQYKKAMAVLWHCHSKQWQQVYLALGRLVSLGSAFGDIVKNAANVAKAFGIPQATMKKIPGISAVFGGAQSFMGGVSNFFGGMFGGDKKSQ